MGCGTVLPDSGRCVVLHAESQKFTGNQCEGHTCVKTSQMSSNKAGWATKALCVLLSLAVLGVWGVSNTAPQADAAEPLPAPANLWPNSRTVTGSVKFAWSKVPGATYYKVTYPNTAGTGTLNATTYSTSFSPYTELPQGNVNWSVLAFNGVDGALSSASFNHEVSNAPTLTCPGPTVNYPKQAPTFTWAPIQGMKQYTLSVSSASNFPVGAATKQYVTQSTSFTLTDGQSDGETFYAKVSGQSAGGINTADSNDCSYKVVWSSGTTDDNDAKPLLVSPSNGKTVREVVLKWAPLLGAARYEVQVSPNGDWTNNLRYDIVTDSATWAPAKTLDNGSYFWRVRGIDNVGNASRWSDYPSTTAGDAWVFTIAPLATPNRKGPVDNTTVTNADFNLSWAPVAGAGAYQLQVSSNASFSDASTTLTCFTTHTDWSPYAYENPPGKFAGPGGTNGCPLNQIDQRGRTDNNVLYWHVRAVDNYTQNELAEPWTTGDFTGTNKPPANGAFVSPWSTAGRFFYNSGAPTLQSPGNGAAVTQPRLVWSRVDGTEYYEVQVNTRPFTWDKNAQQCKIGTSWASKTYKTTATSLTPAMLDAPRVHPVRNAQNTGFDTYPCPVDVTWTASSVDHSKRGGPVPSLRSFQWTGYATAGATTGVVSLTSPSPADMATVTTIPSFAWQPVNGADRYEVWWYDNPTGSTYIPLLDYNQTASRNRPATETFTPVQPLPITQTAGNPTGHGAWQVVALDATGTVIAQSPRRNLVVAFPTEVALESYTTRAQNGAAVVCISGCTTPSTPLISWVQNPDVSYYRVIIARDANFTNIARIYETSNRSIRPVEALPDAQAGESYYVFIQPALDSWWNGVNSTGTIRGAYNTTLLGSQAWSFRKQSSAITDLRTLQPTSLAAASSTNICADNSTGDAIISDAPTFCWNGPAPYASGDVGAMQYHIQVSTTADFGNIIDQAWVDQSSYTPFKASYNNYAPQSVITPPSSQTIRDLTYPDGPLYWRVQAVDGTNNGLTYSATQTVTKRSTGASPESPTNNQIVDSTPSLSWSAKPFAARYEVEVYRNADTSASTANKAFSQRTDLTAITPTNNDRVTGGTSLPEGTYAWRVRGIDAGNESFTWSSWSLFKVDPTHVETFALTSPTAGPFTEQSGIAFGWTTVPGATKYRIYVSSKSSNPKSNADLGTRETVMNSYSPEKVFPAMPTDGNIYWQVEAFDSQNQLLATSNVGSFKYNGTRPTASITAVTPGMGSAQLTWTASNNPAVGALTGIVVKAYQGNAVKFSRTLAGDARSYTFTGLTNGQNYQFTVTPRDAVGDGTESQKSSNVMPSKILPFTNVDRFIQRQFNDLLGRNATANELNTWRSRLGPSGSYNAITMIDSLWNSTSFQSYYPKVGRLYAVCFNRRPDASGLLYWVAKARSGMSTRHLTSAFINGAEYRAVYGGTTNREFVRRIYVNAFGRNPDTGGWNYWTDQLNKNKFSRAHFLSFAVAESTEYKIYSKDRINASLVYIVLLRRSPTATEQANMETYLSSHTVRQAIEQIYTSVEYKNRGI